ncbi:MAG TPA: peptidylprolyl isomerase [Luteibaculaceae bacterium]|nr:peptidylprolyl isomerase [Luteibaculaceae bacterium]
MKFSSVSVLLVSLSLSAAGYAQTLMTVDQRPVSKSEFEAIYKKNNREASTSKEALDDYMDLFVKFKLKVAEAERLGLDTTQSFKNELEGYRKQLAKPYLNDNQLTDALINEAYARMKEEVRASHILIKVGNSDSPADTLKAYKKALEVKKRIEAGESFSAVAEELSDDPSAKQNGGDLGYFTGLTMVYPFESAAFNTAIGKVSDPVRTSFGYHIIRVSDKRPARGEVKVAHILINAGSNDPAEKQKADQEKVNEIYKLLQDGNDFAELAKKYSDDKQSSANGGELPAFGTGKMVETFENQSFELKNTGDYTQPFRTVYGWHIVKLLERKPVPTFDELKPTLMKRIARDDRSRMTRQSFIGKLKKEYRFTAFQANLKPYYKAIDTAYFSGNWQKPSEKTFNKVLMEFDGKKYTQADFNEYLDSWKGKLAKSELTYFIPMMFDRWVETSLMDYEESRLEEKYPEFKALYREYRDGILLFDLTNQMVWNKAIEDTVGLKTFFEQRQTDYMWKRRADADVFRAKDEKTAKKAVKLAKKGLSIEDIKKEINADSQLNLVCEEVVAEVGTNALIDAFDWNKGVSAVKSLDGQYVFVRYNYIMEPQPKKLEEARGLATAAYQTYLEENWLKELKSRYKVEINKDVLYSVR